MQSLAVKTSIGGNVGDIGAFCRSDISYLTCQSPNSFCANNVCTCAPFFELVNDECVMKPSKTLSMECKTWKECEEEGEYCRSSSGKCECLSNYFVLGGKCRPVIYPGQIGCEDSRQCAKAYPGAFCTGQNKCQCPDGLQAAAFTCLQGQLAYDLIF
ncbi:unnamed protein product [Thelazia callipaeda]|uniref:EB domain-containing protein n=1 Tax=Thelazia callipaeda TaxID=103827 RepID=A0A0N5DC47_THECL|nr:unnamed protein product [Thelazia callipaeda]